MNRKLVCTILIASIFTITSISGFGVSINVTETAYFDSSGTTVGGILWENTTWTLENGPYTISDTVQIPENVTLTIEPGVIVTKPTADDLFLIQGRVCAHGTPDNMIGFNGEGNSNFFKTLGATETHAYVDLDYCKVGNGKSLFPCNDYAHLNMTHCEIIDVREPCCPQAPTYVEYNFFKDFCSFVIGTSQYETSEIFIRHNLFLGRSSFSDEYYTVVCVGHGLVVKYNTFLDNDQVLQAYPDARSINITATENYWGTQDTALIDQMIYDRYDDITCADFIEYMPILSEPHPNTPVLPLIANFTYSPTVPYANGTITFDASASFGSYSTIGNYTWDFGDTSNMTSNMPIADHYYTMPGSYDVTLTITDEFGFKKSSTIDITVLQDNVPPTIGTLTSMPEGAVLPDQGVRISVNVTDLMSGVKSVRLSYTSNTSILEFDFPMMFNSTRDLWEFEIPGQQANSLVKYKITAYDNAGNYVIDDNHGYHYTYTVIPEFPSFLILSLFMIVTLLAAMVCCRRITAETLRLS